MNLFWYLGAFLLALAPLIVVHEFGHYLVARWCGVKVLRFSVGFGKPLLAWRLGGDRTEWVLAAIPFGGYVKMLDEHEAPVPPEERQRAFNRQPVGKRMAIVIAGPLANLLLATLIYCGIFMAGVTDLKPYLGEPPADSVAASAGVRSGDLVITLDGDGVGTWTELRKRLLDLALDAKPIELGVVTADGRQEVKILQQPTATFGANVEQDPAEHFGLVALRPPLDPVVGMVAPDSPANRAGMQAGDRIVAIDGDSIATWEDVVTSVQPALGRTLEVVVRRGAADLSLRVMPESVDDNGRRVGRLGIGVRPDPERYAAMTTEVRLGLPQALGRGVAEVWNTSLLSLRMIGRMIIGEASLKNLSGPVTIADYAGQSAEMGLSAFLRFIALVSISVGVLNLLPVPVLDGGHLMYYLAELFKGSPVSDRALEVGQRIGFGILAFLMLFALYNDFHRLISG